MCDGRGGTLSLKRDSDGMVVCRDYFRAANPWALGAWDQITPIDECRGLAIMGSPPTAIGYVAS
jgi:hypothetical protein